MGGEEWWWVWLTLVVGVLLRVLGICVGGLGSVSLGVGWYGYYVLRWFE